MQEPWEVKLWLDDSVGRSFQEKLTNKLIYEIQTGRLKPKMKMPGSRSLAKQLDVNRKTIQLVYNELESQGWLFTMTRRGTFVANVLPEKGLSAKNKKLVLSKEEVRTPNPLLTELYHSALLENKEVTASNDGIPDSRLIPYQVLTKAYRKAIIQATRNTNLGYGDPRGLIDLRRSIQKMLELDRFMSLHEDQICTTRGSQMGIYLISRVLNPAKGVIVCEELSYPPAIAAFESNGFTVVRCCLDKDGLNTDDLENIIKKHNVVAVYTTPHHQYPTTVSMSMKRRLMLLSLSKQHQFWVLEDDYDHEFHYGTNPIPPLSSLPEAENVVHIGSMSKVFAPALRSGYIVGDKNLIDLIAKEVLLIDRQGNTITELAISNLMDSGEVKKHIRRTRKLYQSRRDFALAEFKRIFGKDIVIKKPAGGMALWVDLSKRKMIMEQFDHPDIYFESLFAKENRESTHIRFGFGALEKEEIRCSIKKLAEVWLE